MFSWRSNKNNYGLMEIFGCVTELCLFCTPLWITKSLLIWTFVGLLCVENSGNARKQSKTYFLDKNFAFYLVNIFTFEIRLVFPNSVDTLHVYFMNDVGSRLSQREQKIWFIFSLKFRTFFFFVTLFEVIDTI